MRRCGHRVGTTRTDITLLGGGAEQLGVRFLYLLGENSTKTQWRQQDSVGQISGAGLPKNKVTTSLTYIMAVLTAFLQASLDRWRQFAEHLHESDRPCVSARPAGHAGDLRRQYCTIDDNRSRP